MEKVLLEKEGSIAIITINNPPANALNSLVITELDETLNLICQDDDVKVVVLTGAGKFFVSGADIKEIAQYSNKEDGERLSLLGQKVFTRIEEMKKPVIAAINGACLGGGMELAMGCHIRLASENAQFGQPEINLGLIPGFGGTQRLARLTNQAIALEWLLTGDLYSAQEAWRIGLINQVISLDNLLSEAKKMAQKIATKGKIAISYNIDTVVKGRKSTLSEGLQYEAKRFGELFETFDKQEGVNAFLEKRKANFQDH